MSTAVLSLGSNLGDRTAHLQRAVDLLGRRVRAVSSVYRTPPWGGVEQDDFHNLTLIAEDPTLDPHGWLTLCQSLETDAGRVRDVRWGPRTLDADVIAVDETTFVDDDLTVPHPRAAERAFVLIPWAEIDPTAELPGRGHLADLIAALPASERDPVRRIGHVH